MPPATDIGALANAAWNGIPARRRPLTWLLLLGVAPTARARRRAAVERRTAEYRKAVEQHYGPALAGCVGRPAAEGAMLRQIQVDMPRTAPHVPLFRTKSVQDACERVLFVWAARHPASGYVQGINDVLTPFMDAFIGEAQRRCGAGGADAYAALPESERDQIEALAYACLTRTLDTIQDNYTAGQPGIQVSVHKLQAVVRRVDAALYAHLEGIGIPFLQFAFRWMNCMLLRELPWELVPRLWDTYLAQGHAGGGAMNHFHVYVCAALLTHFSADLRGKDFAEALMFLQALPTDRMSERDVSELFSQAFVWLSVFGQAPHHLSSQ